VILSGGPDGLPRIWPRPDDAAEQVKIRRANGYEHFEFAGEYAEHDGERLPVYRWCYRTYIAE
jgi:hypothetical protein